MQVVVFCISSILLLLFHILLFVLMIRRPPRSTLDRSSAASDVYKRQVNDQTIFAFRPDLCFFVNGIYLGYSELKSNFMGPVSYTHLRAHETVLDLVCRLLLEKKQQQNKKKKK